jgi:hypothetical protein
MKQNDIVTLLGITLVVVISWIAFNLHSTYTQTTISPTQNLQIVPITAEFDTQTINNLKTRERITPNYKLDANAVEQKNSQVTPTGRPTPSATSLDTDTAPEASQASRPTPESEN